MAATQRVVLSFTRRTVGVYANQWTIPGRRGKVAPKLERADRHGPAVGTVTTGEYPIENGVVKQVFVELPWRGPASGLTTEEVAQILALAAERIGEYTVID